MEFVKDPLEAASIFGQKVQGTSNMKWKFFMMSVVYKLNCSPKTPYHQYPAVAFIFLFLAMSCMSVINIGSFIGENKFIDKPEDAIFPQSFLFSFITPYLLSSFEFMFICFLLQVIFLIVFIACYCAPFKMIIFEKFLKMSVHFTLLPINTCVATYACYCVKRAEYLGIPQVILCFLYIVTYIVYMFILFITGLSASYSVINPKPLYATWFSYMNINIPYYISALSFLYSLIPRLNYEWKIAFYGITMFISITGTILIFWELPFVFFPTNEFYITIAFTNFLRALFGLLVTVLDSNFSLYFYGLIPLAVYVFHYIISKLAEMKRMKYLDRIKDTDTVDNLTYDYLSEVFDSIEDEHTMKMVIKAGLQNGSKTVVSKQFAGYVLGRFPGSTWILLYINYLYAVVWGIDDESYQYLLHLLSLDTLEMRVQMPIFESLYCYMQLTGSRSPLIKNELKKFQEITIQFAESYKRFWGCIADSKEDFYRDLSHIYRITTYGSEQIKNLVTSFPFCAEVQFQRSIFLADFKKNFMEASVAASKGTQLLQNGQSVIAATLNEKFRPFYNGSEGKKVSEIKQEPDQYTFLSVSEHASDFAVRHPNNPINDDYLKKNSNSYTAQRNHIFHEVPFANNAIQCFFVLIILTVILFLLVLICYIVEYKIRCRENDEEVELHELMFQSREFIDTTEMLFYDLATISNISDESFNKFYTVSSEELFRKFMKDHVDLIYYKVNDFVVNMSKYTKFVNFASVISPCTQNNVTFEFPFLVYIDTEKQMITSGMRNEVDLFKESWVNLFSLRTTVINATMQYINKTRDYLQDRVDKHFGRDLYKRIAFSVSYIVISIVIALAAQLIFEDLKGQIFAVFKTLQQPVRQTIEREFDNLLGTKDPTICIPDTKYSLPNNFWYVLSTIFYLIPCICEISYVLATKNSDVPSYYDANLLNPLVSGNGYYAHATMEFALENIYTNTSSFNDIHNEEVCVHNYFMRAEKYDLIKPYAYLFTSVWLKVVVFISLTLSVAFYIMFIYKSIVMIRVFKASRYLLFAIPTKVGRANPLFYNVITGRSIFSGDVNKFVDEVEDKSESFSYFGFIRFDDDEKVVSTSDNVAGILGFIPSNLREIVDYLDACEMPEEEVAQFFANRELGDALVCYDDKRNIDFVIEFTNKKTLFIKDENAATGVARKPNKQKIISFKLKSFAREKFPPIKEAGSIIIEGLSVNEVRSIYEMSKSYSELKFLDARFAQLSFCVDYSHDEAEIAKKCVDFIMEAIKLTKKGRAVVTKGGPLALQDMRKHVEKSRFVGKSHSNAISAVLTLPFTDRIIIQKEVYELAKLTNAKEEKVVSVSPSSTMTVCLL